MSLNHLPPQAYTKETLAKAYSWLNAQSKNIKDLATTPDVLVSLYLKAQMHGEEFIDRPSIQNFKNDLKTLAGLMGEFEAPTPNPTAPVAPTQMAPPPLPTPSPQVNMSPAQSFTKNEDLDAGTRAILGEVKTQLNLSSETEALRMLVSVGYRRVKTLY